MEHFYGVSLSFCEPRSQSALIVWKSNSSNISSVFYWRKQVLVDIKTKAWENLDIGLEQGEGLFIEFTFSYAMFINYKYLCLMFFQICISLPNMRLSRCCDRVNISLSSVCGSDSSSLNQLGHMSFHTITRTTQRSCIDIRAAQRKF